MHLHAPALCVIGFSRFFTSKFIWRVFVELCFTLQRQSASKTLVDVFAELVGGTDVFAELVGGTPPAGLLYPSANALVMRPVINALGERQCSA